MNPKYKKATIFGSIIELVIVIGVIALVSTKLAAHGSSASSGTTTNPPLTVNTTTETPDGNSGTTEASRQDEPQTTPKPLEIVQEKVLAYYHALLAVLIMLLLTSIAVIVGGFKEFKELMKAHFHMNHPLTLLSLILYVLIVWNGTPHKDIIFFTGFYNGLRIIVHIIETFHLDLIGATASAIRHISVTFRNSGNVDISDIAEAPQH